jgi:hypothetical protein
VDRVAAKPHLEELSLIRPSIGNAHALFRLRRRPWTDPSSSSRLNQRNYSYSRVLIRRVNICSTRPPPLPLADRVSGCASCDTVKDGRYRQQKPGMRPAVSSADGNSSRGSFHPPSLTSNNCKMKLDASRTLKHTASILVSFMKSIPFLNWRQAQYNLHLYVF